MLSTRTCDTGRQMFGTIAYCRGVVVAIRKFSVSSIDLNKKNLLELKQVLYMIYHIFHLQSKVNKYYKLETFDFMYMNYIRGPVKRNSRPSYIFHYLMHQYWYDKFHFIWCKDIFVILSFCHHLALYGLRYSWTVWKVYWNWLNIE